MESKVFAKYVDPNLLSLIENVSKEATKSVPTESNGAVVKEEPHFRTKWCSNIIFEHDLSFSQIRMGVYKIRIRTRFRTRIQYIKPGSGPGPSGSVFYQLRYLSLKQGTSIISFSRAPLVPRHTVYILRNIT